MIEKSGVLIHLDPKGDRTGKSDLEFDGWIVADKPVKAVWLPAAGRKPLTICERPDVRRVFPNRTALGFSGKSRGRDIGPKGLTLAVQVGDETFEIDYPLPPPVARQSFRERIVSALQLRSLVVRERLATNSSKRWSFTLRRHLLYRQRRLGIFRPGRSSSLLMASAISISSK
jgi:hypothetical protein